MAERRSVTGGVEELEKELVFQGKALAAIKEEIAGSRQDEAAILHTIETLTNLLDRPAFKPPTGNGNGDTGSGDPS